MEPIRNTDRSQQRPQVELALLVWGVDTEGEPFVQQARARNISLSGALLSGLDSQLTSGDVVGIFFAGRKARYRVVWVRYSGTSSRIQAAVHRIAPDACPWQDLLSEPSIFPPSPPTTPAQ